MSLWSKIVGTIESYWQIGLAGPRLKANSGAVDVRNAGDSAYAVIRGATPVGNNDLVTKQYADTLATRYVITDQFDGNDALPANTATEHFSVVTTTGTNAAIGDLIWDDGTSTGTAVLLPTAQRLIMTQTALTGGTISFAADSMYWWDTTSGAWINVGGSTMSGAQRVIKFATTNAASQSSTAEIPANAVVLSATLEVTTPYSAGATVSIGRTGSTALIQATTDNLATVAGTYDVPQDTAWGATALPVLITVAGTPAAGAGFCIVQYVVPDA
jgi:hypothetical protein